jgi:nicotinate-nucleotide adenylyltransferase
MRVGLFGGSFDPPHRGHVALARAAMERVHLDRVLIVPVGAQPLKQGATAASFEDRMEMARLAFAGQPRMELSLLDAPKANGKPNYTMDTVAALQKQLGADDAIFCLMGADSFMTIGKWHRSVELLLRCDFIVGARPGFDLGRLTAALPEKISVATESVSEAEAGGDGYLMLGLRGPDGGHSRLYLLPDLAEDVSATEIREELREVSGIRHNVDAQRMLDPMVVKYIHDHGLYLNR